MGTVLEQLRTRPGRGARWLAVAAVVTVTFGAEHRGNAELAYEQIGDDIEVAPRSPSGPRLAVSYDAHRIAVGSTGTGSELGIVRVYARNGAEWTQLGGDLVGDVVGDQFGATLSLSSDGSRLAVGAWYFPGGGDSPGHVRVFEWDGSNWVQLGNDINGDADHYYAGIDVDLTSDGNRVAVAGITQVRVFDWNGTDWMPAGGRLPEGERGIAMSADGLRIAVGPTGEFGEVETYDRDGSDWIQLAQGVVRPRGGCVTMSADGRRLTSCASGNPPIFSESYDRDEAGWRRVGAQLAGAVGAMSADGSRVALFDPVRIFDWNENSWIEAPPLPSGDRSVALSADGATVAVGVAGDVVRVFGIAEALPPTSSTTTMPQPSVTTPPPTTLRPPDTLPPTGPPTSPANLLILAIAVTAVGSIAVMICRHGDHRVTSPPGGAGASKGCPPQASGR